MTIEKALLIQQLEDWSRDLNAVLQSIDGLEVITQESLDKINSIEMGIENLLNLLKND